MIFSPTLDPYNGALHSDRTPPNTSANFIVFVKWGLYRKGGLRPAASSQQHALGGGTVRSAAVVARGLPQLSAVPIRPICSLQQIILDYSPCTVLRPWEAGVGKVLAVRALGFGH